MKNISVIIILLFSSFLLISFKGYSQTQLTPEERKTLKKELNTYKKAPEKYKDMKDQNAAKIFELEAELENLRLQLTAEWRKVDSLNTVVTEAEQTISEFQNSETDCGKVPSQGTVYSVQIGNYKRLDIKNSFNTNKGLRTENTTGGVAYLIGNFATAEEALKFVSDIKKFGITDAFVTQYIDGSRIMDFDASKNR